MAESNPKTSVPMSFSLLNLARRVSDLIMKSLGKYSIDCLAVVKEFGLIGALRLALEFVFYSLKLILLLMKVLKKSFLFSYYWFMISSTILKLCFN
jgi:hypothetical protein